MRKLFDNAAERLRRFLVQRDNLALVVSSPEGDLPALLQILDTVEQESSFALFWQFPESFTDTAEYVSVIVESFAARLELIRSLQQREQLEPWPELPEVLRGGSLLPAQRMRALMVFARSLMPSLEGAVLVWILFPGDIADAEAYGQLLRDVLRHEWPLPWCHHIRFIVREDPAQPSLHSTQESAARVEWFQPDFGPAAVASALQRDIDDPQIPLEDRLQSLLVTAGMDQAHRRTELAREKFQLLHQHYVATGNLVMAAVALNGLGEVFREEGKASEASQCFEAAMIAASETPQTSTPVMLNVSLNLANLRMEQQRWAEAEGYYDCSQRLATVLRYADTKLMILEHLGLAQRMQNKTAQARETWQAGAAAARKLDRPELEARHLERLASA